ncbi:MAG TPA: HAD-IA family hydrolase [Vicinamibacterales bacterium]|nr:HAD-IA family hydrolase [Vicinamibacterales bacterium]
MSRFSLIVFDLDGTLIDSRRDLANATNALLVECGGEPLEEERVGRMVGDGAPTLVARAFAASGVAPPREAVDRFLRIYRDHLLDYTRPYPGIPDLLEALRAHRRLAVLTNKPLASTRRILDGLALAQYFPPDAVIGGDGPLPRKPDPAGLRHLAQCAHVALTDTLLVGDSAIDWRTARAAPSAVCLVRYGFGFEGISAEELDVEVRVIDAPSELMSL